MHTRGRRALNERPERPGHRGRIALCVPAAVALITLILALAASFALEVDRVEAYGEAGTGKYSFSNTDVIEICTTNRCTGVGNQNTNTFAPGATIYVHVHTDRVVNGTGYLYLYNYWRKAIPPAWGYVRRVLSWTRVGSDYYAQLTLPATQANHMRLYGQVINGGDQVTFQDEIKITTQPSKFMNFYWTGPQAYPPSPADESYTYKSGDIVNVMAYGSARAYNATYTTNSMKDIATGASTPLTMSNWSRISSNYHRYRLQLPASGLTDGEWYSINSHFMYSSTTLIFDMSRMILIDDSPPSAAIDSPAGSAFVKGVVPVTGTADDQYSYYQYVLEYGVGAAPSTWTTIGSQTNMPPIQSGTLGNWDTTSLIDGQLYTLRLTVSDRAGKAGTTNPPNQTAVSRQVYVDNNPPVISGVGALPIVSNGATINWTTDEPADSQVEYGISSGVYDHLTALDPTSVTSHSQPLTGLEQNRRYYYRVISTDRGGNTTTSGESNFVTAHLTVLQPYAATGTDTNLASGQPTWNWGADGSLRVGDLAGAGDTYRGLIRFDLSGLAGTTIASARLSLFQMDQADASQPVIDVHYLTGDWQEGAGTGTPGPGATWQTSGIAPWTGGNYWGTRSAFASGRADPGWVNWDLTALTQSWVNASITNYGALIKRNSENAAASEAKSFYSSDSTVDRLLRPVLTVEWFGSDTTPPNIGEVRTQNVSLTSTDITWSTDEDSNSQVEYGTTTNYGSTTAVDNTLVNQHTVSLAGFTPDTVYHYRVYSADASGNQAVSGDYVFQTARQLIIQPSPVPGKDTWISSAGTSLNNGGAPDIAIGDNSAAAESRRALIKFDLSSIPAGSVVNSATLSLCEHAQQNSLTPELGAYYAIHSWEEGTGNGAPTADGATWTSYDGNSLHSWGVPGGDFDTSSPPTAVAPDISWGGPAWINFSVTNLAQQWIDGTIANEGAFIKKTAENTTLNDYKTFYSSDYLADTNLRPKLVIEYVPAPGTITLNIDETFNRDASPGSGSVGFGNVNPGTPYDVGEGGLPDYAVGLSVKSNVLWGLEVDAQGDLAQVDPTNFIDIASLKWKRDGEPAGNYQAMVKYPAQTTIASGRMATNRDPFLFDYRLAVPLLATSGSYSTSIIYTAYTS